MSSVATGFSAEIDSFATVALYDAPSAPDGLRITHLTVLDVGAFEGASDAGPIFHLHNERARRFADERGLRSLPLGLEYSRNISSYLQGLFRKTHTLPNAAAALAAGASVQAYLYSSAVPYRDLKVIGVGASPISIQFCCRCFRP